MSQDAVLNAEVVSAFVMAMLGNTGAATVIAASGTIDTAKGLVRLNPAAAVAGIIMAPGTRPGQLCCVVNEAAAANTITMAALATSNVSNGVLNIITGPAAKVYVWNSLAATPAWYSLAGA